MVRAPAFLIGALVIFVFISGIVHVGLPPILRWLAGNSRLFREKILSSLTDKKLDSISIIVGLIITAVLFYQIISRGTDTTIIILFLGLTGLGIVGGLILSFINLWSSSRSNLRNGLQTTPLDTQYISKESTKEVITETMIYDGHLVYIIGKSDDELSLFHCPICGQMHAVSKGKRDFIFECHKCNNTINIARIGRGDVR